MERHSGAEWLASILWPATTTTAAAEEATTNSPTATAAHCDVYRCKGAAVRWVRPVAVCARFASGSEICSLSCRLKYSYVLVLFQAVLFSRCEF